jgi:hypothetical protein
VAAVCVLQGKRDGKSREAAATKQPPSTPEHDEPLELAAALTSLVLRAGLPALAQCPAECRVSLGVEHVAPVHPPVEVQLQVLTPTHTPPLAHGAAAQSDEPEAGPGEGVGCR